MLPLTSNFSDPDWPANLGLSEAAWHPSLGMNLFALTVLTSARNDEDAMPSRSDRSDVLCTSGDR